jgi:hypothetical protein
MKKTAKIESTRPPEYTGVKRLDKYAETIETIDHVVEFQYWDKYRSPKISARIKNFIFGGILLDKYNGLRRDEFIQKQYSIKSIGFGSWVKNEDRINFLAILAVSLYDLQSIFKTNDLGKGRLQLDWGGVGKKGAAGVFFPTYNLITMPRYKRPDKYLAQLESYGINTRPYRDRFFEKISSIQRGELLTLNKEGKAWIMQTAGWGSWAHEYGHFMDHYIATKFFGSSKRSFVTGFYTLPDFRSAEFFSSKLATKQRTASVTVGYITALFNDGKETEYSKLNACSQAFFDWLVAMYFIKQKDQTYRPNTQYNRLLKFVEDNGAKWKYWGSLVELWARSFEVYIDEFLSRKGINNTFLVRMDKKFGRDVRILEGGKVVTINSRSAYITGAHVWQNKKVFEKIINIFVKY